MRYFINIFFLLIISVATMSMPAVSDTLKLLQSDGSVVEVRLLGDEHFHYYQSLDGRWLQRNSNGDLMQIEPMSESQIEQKRTLSPMRKMRNQRVKRYFPTKGEQKSLVILAQFEDVKFTTPNSQIAFHTMLNQTGYAANGATGSARDYYIASSNGQFSPQFVTVGPYTLPHELSYYGGNTNSGDRPSRLMQFCRDAVAAAADDVDYTEYDTDGDGYIDNVFIYYAGYSEAEGGNPDCIWPHQYGVYPDSVIGTCTFDGKTISSYACTSELKGYTGNVMCGIGTFCHEFGHVLGLPDYYHTATSQYSTLGRWDVMDSGGYLNGGNTPPTHSAYNRFCLGWLSPTQINQPATLNVYTLSQDYTVSASTQAYLLAAGQHNMNAYDPNYPEFFIIEYRRKIGWDAFLPDSGIVVWHIDYDYQAWEDNTVNNVIDSIQTENSHMRVYIENPSNTHTISNPSTFHSGDWFMPILWSGSMLGQNVDIVKESSDYATFHFMGGGFDKSAPVALEPEVISYNSMRAAWHPIENDDYEVSYLFTAFTLAGGDTAYLVRRELVTDTIFLLSNLKEETIYTYYVSAYLQSSDTAIETFKSNIIKATTLVEKSQRKMTLNVVRSVDGAEIFVSKPQADDVLYVFNELGQLLFNISTTDNLVSIKTSQLQTGHTYVLRAGTKYAKIAL